MKRLAGILLLAGACSSSDSPSADLATEEDRQTADETSPTTEEEPTTTTTEAPADAAREYFEAIAGDSASQMRAAIELADLGGSVEYPVFTEDFTELLFEIPIS